jgi:hypothetical protein
MSRRSRFRQSDALRRVFEAVVSMCIAAGLVGGEAFSVDASLIEADVDKKKRVPILLKWSYCGSRVRSHVGAAASQCRSIVHHRGVTEPVRPPGTSMLVQVPCCTNFQELPWKSTVEVP